MKGEQTRTIGMRGRDEGKREGMKGRRRGRRKEEIEMENRQKDTQRKYGVKSQKSLLKEFLVCNKNNRIAKLVR